VKIVVTGKTAGLKSTSFSTLREYLSVFVMGNGGGYPFGGRLVVSTSWFAEAPFAGRNRTPLMQNPALESGVCKSTGVERGMLLMILLMLAVCLLLRLRRVGIKIDFWF
jgi:hypothetical protein